jgi:hypothetical protein
MHLWPGREEERRPFGAKIFAERPPGPRSKVLWGVIFHASASLLAVPFSGRGMHFGTGEAAAIRTKMGELLILAVAGLHLTDQIHVCLIHV